MTFILRVRMWGAGCAGGGAAPLLCCLLLRLVMPVFGSHLIRNLTQDYDSNAWPTMNSGGPTVVTVQVYISSFGAIDVSHMEFNIDVSVHQRWNDPRLKHPDIVDHFTIMDSALQNTIWKPDTYFENAKKVDLHDVTVPNRHMRVYTSGDVLWSVRASLGLACHLQLALYPFDVQKCYLHISSYANTAEVIRYQWIKDKPVILSETIAIAKFFIVANRSITRIEFKTGMVGGNYSVLSTSFTLHRLNGHSLTQTYVPTAMIVILSWLSFWIDPKVIPGRLALGLTPFLTLTTLTAGMRQSLPPVSYVRAIDVWVGVCMSMVFSVLLQFLFVNYLVNKEMINSKLPDYITIPAFISPPPDPASRTSAGPVKRQGEGPTYLFYALVLDRICRILYPGVFLFFNIVYWPYYTTMQNNLRQKMLKED